MLAPRVLISALVQRLLPPAFFDDADNDRRLRAWRYGELTSVSMLRKQQALNEEGSYFTCNNGQTGVATGTPTAFTATNPAVIIFNSDLVTNASYKRVSLDYLDLVTTAAGTESVAGTLQLAVLIDSGNRYSSGGTVLTSNITRPNGDLAIAGSVAQVYAGNLTATAATGAVRTAVGVRSLRGGNGATSPDIVGEDKHINFGGVEGMNSGTVTVASANLLSFQLPPITIGPQQSALVYLWYSGATLTVGASYAPELGWNER